MMPKTKKRPSVAQALAGRRLKLVHTATAAHLRYDAFGEVQKLDLTSSTSPDTRHDRRYGGPILKRHPVDKVPVSDICNEEELHPSLFYSGSARCSRPGRGAGDPAPATGPSKREKEQAHELAQLKARLAKKDEVIAESRRDRPRRSWPPTGGHYSGRSSDAGYAGPASSSGGDQTSVPLDLPGTRGGLPVPVQIVYGEHGVGAAGLGWNVPLSYLRRDTTLARRRLAGLAEVAPQAREQVSLVLDGRRLELVSTTTAWIARRNAPDLQVREQGDGTWVVFDGQGRTYLFTVASPAIPAAQQGRITMGVRLAEDASGAQCVLIGTSEPRGYLRPGVTLAPGETLAPGLGHAEADVVNFAQQNGLRLLEVGATRPICPACTADIEWAGARPVTPLKVP
jgi:transposase-like protein